MEMHGSGPPRLSLVSPGCAPAGHLVPGDTELEGGGRPPCPPPLFLSAVWRHARRVTPLLPPGTLVVCGLRAEARLLPRGTRTVCAGGNAERLRAALAAEAPSAVLSFGIAGGLAPMVETGALFCATAIARTAPADPAWAARLREATGATPAVLAGSESVLDGPGAKARLFAETGAAAVDMESGIAAAFAAARGIPFAALRAVADPAQGGVPRAAQVGLRPDGRTAPLAVLGALLAAPGDLPALLTLAGQTRRALRVLRLAGKRLAA